MDLVYLTTRVPDTIVTRMTRVQHECDTSATQTTRVQHEQKTLILITAQMKTYFSYPYISYTANERL